MTRQLLTDNVYLTYVPSEKFKTSFLSAQMVMPLASRTAGLNALLVNVLSRGTARCPDMDALGRELDMLYGARLDPAVRRKGENQIFGFVASCVDDRRREAAGAPDRADGGDALLPRPPGRTAEPGVRGE